MLLLDPFILKMSAAYISEMLIKSSGRNGKNKKIIGLQSRLLKSSVQYDYWSQWLN